jgi:hypothetical protein
MHSHNLDDRERLGCTGPATKIVHRPQQTKPVTASPVPGVVVPPPAQGQAPLPQATWVTNERMEAIGMTPVPK